MLVKSVLCSGGLRGPGDPPLWGPVDGEWRWGQGPTGLELLALSLVWYCHPFPPTLFHGFVYLLNVLIKHEKYLFFMDQ